MTPFEYINCNLCHTDNTELVFVATENQFQLGGSFNVVKCKKCGLVYVNPRPPKEEIGFFYPKGKYYTHCGPARNIPLRHRLKYLVIRSLPGYNTKTLKFKKILGRFLGQFLSGQIDVIVPFRKNGRILDVGCGHGGMTGWMRRYGWETYGVDISKEACEQAKKQGLHVFCGELQEAHFSPEFFDVITVNHVLEHVHDPLTLLKECNRVLKKDGLLIVDVPNFWCFDSKLFREYWQAVDMPRHLYHFTRDTLNKILNVAGFEVNKWKFKFPFPLYDRASVKLYRENNEGVSSKILLGLILKASLFKLINYIFSKDRCCRFSVNLTAYASKRL